MSKETNQRLLDKLQQDLASTGAMPLYLRFNASVRQAIEQGLLNAGDFLPSERLFTERLGISRITVRAKRWPASNRTASSAVRAVTAPLSNRNGPSRSCSIHWRTSKDSRAR